MPPTLAASQTIDTIVTTARRSRGAIGFAIGFGVAAATTIVATIMAVSGTGLAEETSPTVIGLLSVSLIVCMVLAGILTHRIIRIRRGSADTGARLHLKFVALFS